MNHVLGGNGFIGSNIVRIFDASIIKHDLLSPTTDELGDIEKNDIVFHAAHFGSIDECASNPIATREVNVAGTMRFLEAVHNKGAIPAYFSTNMVFDGMKSFYFPEDTPSPVTEYGRQKREIEKYIISKFKRYVIIRMTKVYGLCSRSFIDTWIESLLRNQEIQAAYDVYSAPVFIQDVMKEVGRFIGEAKHGIFHISGPKERSLQEIAEILMHHTKSDPQLLRSVSIHELSLQEMRPLHNSLSCDTIVRDIPEILRAFYS